jgi:hypothetical protein
MPSPFLGFDPFIESCGLWEDFHAKLVGEIEMAAAMAVPPQYLVRINERSYVVLSSSADLEPKRHMIQADVGVTRPSDTASGTPLKSTGGTVAMVADDEAVTIRALVEAEFREVFVEISALSPDRKLVTTIELLSPSNKRHGSVGWRQYLRKRQAHLEGQANLVEIDLVRGGQRMPMEEDWPASPGYVLTCWRKTAPVCKVWPAFVDRPLPKLRVPLAPPDDDLTLDLQAMVDAIYDRSRYAMEINYHRPCHPPLDDRTAAWLHERLSQRG